MAGVAAFGAVTVGFTALAGSSRDGPATEITDGGKLAEQIVFLGFQMRQRIVHSGASSAYNNAKIYATKKGNPPPSHFDVALNRSIGWSHSQGSGDAVLF